MGLRGLGQIEDQFHVVVKSHTYLLNPLDQIVEQLLPLQGLLILRCFQLVLYLLGALVVYHCISLLE